jgi:C4-dicarboxylate transporter DctM subunit
MLIPVLKIFNWTPIWFGVAMTVNLDIGQLSPPVAVNLHVICNIANISLKEVSKAILPFILLMIAVLAIVIYFPWLSITSLRCSSCSVGIDFALNQLFS